MLPKLNILTQSDLTDDDIALLEQARRRCAGRIILSTSLASSGHPGGSLSSLDALLVLYSCIRHNTADLTMSERDRFIVSIGHISPAVYSVLVEAGFLREEEFLCEFRRAGSACAGHVELAVPGVEFGTGNLGQGLSVGTGFALASGCQKKNFKTIVMMGDGEQQKGQIAEARRFAAKYELADLIAVVDRNHLQIGGSTEDVMPVRVRDEYAAAGWNVVYVADGHDFNGLYKAIRRAWLHENLEPKRPTVLVVRTIMGHGISFMENKAKYHGSTLKAEDAQKALVELGLDGSLFQAWKEKRDAHSVKCASPQKGVAYPQIDPGKPIVYGVDVKTDCRSAYGDALEDLARLNNQQGGLVKIAGFSCDLEGSVKMQGIRKVSPEGFFEAGIQEHHAATCAGALTKEGVVAFFSTFGVFAAAETYNQHRLNDLNHTHIKVVSTHLGLDVGEDGPTHQSIDYLGLMNNLLGFSVFMPADPNQTGHIVRHVAKTPGNAFVGMGRSKLPTITNEQGEPYFGEQYCFEPGKADLIRQGADATIIVYGTLVREALKAHDLLKESGISVAVLNMASLKPVDEEAIVMAAKAGAILTLEDHIPQTGLGALVAMALATRGISQRLQMLGVTQYGSSGDPADLYKAQGLDAGAVAAKIRAILGK